MSETPVNSGHTPGPWTAKGPNGKYFIDHDWTASDEEAAHSSAAPVHANGQVVALVVAASDDHFDSFDSFDYLDANARLIAAAPDLLKALRLAVRQNSHDMVMTGEELRECEAAILSATGG